jgi:ribosomal protein L7/L12
MSNSEEQLKQLIKDGRKIEAIKMLREHDKLGLKESKERVEALQALMIQSGEMDASRAGAGCAGIVLLIMCGLSFFVF